MSGDRRHRTGDQALVRQINLSTIMQFLRQHAPISRASLAELTGLNKTTVSSLVRELVQHNYVHEVGIDSTGPGRPARLLEMNPDAGFIVSAEIGVDFILAICTDFASRVIWRRQVASDPDQEQEAIVRHVAALLQEALAAGHAALPRLLGVSVGVPGLFDRQTGTLLFAPNLRWTNVPLQALLSRELGVVPILENEANMATVGEHLFGAARGYDDVLYISVGVGLGGGIISNGRLSGGATGFASEFGHMTMDPDGALCNCGNRGCWETQVSQRALFRAVREALAAGTPSELAAANHDQLTVARITEAARLGDAVALTALRQIGRYLGIGIASLVNAFSPELIVLGGILSLAGEFLLPEIDAELERRALHWNREATRVTLSEHGFDACVLGGVALVYQAIQGQPAAFAAPPASAGYITR